MASRNRYREGMIARARLNERAGGQISGIFDSPALAETYRVATIDILARIIHEGSLRKRADAKRDGHSKA
ncbi:MAG: hypothetical protein JJE16_09540 [Nitrospiraceae bacterium]|nr:hypothetical protein [Nitrospiraceae bacterium]